MFLWVPAKIPATGRSKCRRRGNTPVGEVQAGEWQSGFPRRDTAGCWSPRPGRCLPELQAQRLHPAGKADEWECSGNEAFVQILWFFSCLAQLTQIRFSILRDAVRNLCNICEDMYFLPLWVWKRKHICSVWLVLNLTVLWSMSILIIKCWDVCAGGRGH